MTEVLYDTNRVPYTEERISNFIEALPDEIEMGNEPDITLSIRKYPKRYFISFEVDEFLSFPYDPVDGEDASRCYIPMRDFGGKILLLAQLPQSLHRDNLIIVYGFYKTAYSNFLRSVLSG